MAEMKTWTCVVVGNPRVSDRRYKVRHSDLPQFDRPTSLGAIPPMSEQIAIYVNGRPDNESINPKGENVNGQRSQTLSQ